MFIYFCVMKNIVMFGGGGKTPLVKLNTVIARDVTVFKFHSFLSPGFPIQVLFKHR